MVPELIAVAAGGIRGGGEDGDGNCGNVDHAVGGTCNAGDQVVNGTNNTATRNQNEQHLLLLNGSGWSPL